MEKLFTELLDKYNGFSSSFKGRDIYKENWKKEVDSSENLENGKMYFGKNYWDPSKSTYGELTAKCAEDIVSIVKDLCKANKTEKIIDLGSGIGKAVVAMHYADIFKQVDGVELLETLSTDSLEVIKEYGKIYNKDISNINIFNDDIFNLDLSDYDIVISNTAVNEELKERIIKKLNKELKKGSIIISSISSFIDTNLEFVKSYRSMWSWGESAIAVSIKV